MRPWGVRALTWEPAVQGHTNESYFVDGSCLGGEVPARFVLRRSHPGKSAARIAREETILSTVGEEVRAPRIVPTREGRTHLEIEGRVIHVFERRPGTCLPVTSVTPVRARRAFAQLKVIHRALARVPCDPAHPFEWMWERHAAVTAAGPRNLPAFIDLDPVIHRIGSLLEQALVDPALAETRAPDPQWLHGDYHLGNILFEGDEVTGVVDFDDAGRGSPVLEEIFACFAITRNATVEDRFVHDRKLWLELRGGGTPSALLERLFCADQVLLHLHGAQRGCWALGPGIGFLGCLATLMKES